MQHRAIGRFIVYFIVVILAIPNSYGQYKISGYFDSEQKQRTIYLSLLMYDEETMITGNQILFSIQTDSLGYFEFKGQLLSEKDKLYRIHSNSDNSKGLNLVSNSDESNYSNFIFSNSDTICFESFRSNWFNQSENTNKADYEWREFKSFEKKLIEGYSQIKNSEARQQAINNYAKNVKSYCAEKISHPLVKLLAFAGIKNSKLDLKADFKNDPEYYNDLLNSLEKYYSKTSYYLQYQDEISKISNTIIQEKYSFHKRLNYVLGILILISILYSVFLFRKTRLLLVKEEQYDNLDSTLTNQEEKIAKLILEGKSNKEIADELFISLSTVKTHIRNLYAKLNVTNRHELSNKFKNHTED